MGRAFLKYIYVLALVFSTSVYIFASPQDEIAILEDELQITDVDMYTMIYLRELSEWLHDVCSEALLDEWHVWVQRITKNLDSIYADMNQAQILQHSRVLYERLRMQHTLTADRLPGNEYCVVKWVMYHVQQHLRDVHLAILEESEIVKDFEWFDVQALHGRSVKKVYLEERIDELEVYKERLGEDISFTIQNPWFDDALDAERKELLSLNATIMKLTVYKVLYDLIDAGLFTRKDVDILTDVIELEYVDTCGVVNGKYEIKETLSSSGKHISYETQRLYLKVNVCGNFFVLRDMTDIYEKIVTHELGHHFYYYHDRVTHDDFKDICRSSVNQIKDNCKESDFVSDYAQTLAVEDYAEHFMYRFLDILPRSNSILESKSRHFE